MKPRYLVIIAVTIVVLSFLITFKTCHQNTGSDLKVTPNNTVNRITNFNSINSKESVSNKLLILKPSPKKNVYLNTGNDLDRHNQKKDLKTETSNINIAGKNNTTETIITKKKTTISYDDSGSSANTNGKFQSSFKSNNIEYFIQFDGQEKSIWVKQKITNQTVRPGENQVISDDHKNMYYRVKGN